MSSESAVEVDRGEGMVLVVDDDSSTRALFETVLARAGFVVHTAADGEQALRVLAQADFDVVLLDSSLPGMSGLEVLAEIRTVAGRATLPVLMVTGRDALRDRVAGLEAGASDYVLKPVEVDELVARVRSQVRHGAAWSDLHADLERRLDAVTLLRRVQRADTPEATARAVCHELVRLDTLHGAAVLVARAGGLAVLDAGGALAHWAEPGWRLEPETARAVLARLPTGPWLQSGEGERRGAANAEDLPVPGAVAVAPLEGSGGTVGALVLVARPDRHRSAHLLSAAIDLSVAVSSLVVPELAQSEALDTTRRRVRDIVHGHGFVSVYQPIVRLGDGRVLGYEALTRWVDGSAPGDRFAEAARLGIAGEVERETLRTALADARFGDDLWLSVNVSVSCFVERHLHEVLVGAHRPLVVELTEHEPIDDEHAVRAALSAIPGATLAVDDAGAGYASLQRVLSLRPGFVKLDLAWARGIDADVARQALVAGLVRFSEECGSRLIAEGVETEAEHDTLLHLGVELGQGYLYGRPGPLPV